MKTRLSALSLALLFTLYGCDGIGGDSDSSSRSQTPPDPVSDGAGEVEADLEGDGEIHVLSNRPDLISGGDALIEVRLPEASDAGNFRLRLNQEDVTDSLTAMDDAGIFRGLVSGMDLGENTLRLEVPGNGVTTTTITNHPTGGPIFSGPQIQPWNCTNPQAVDDQCNQPPEISFKYLPDSTFQQFLGNFDPQDPGFPDAFVEYDPENPPADDDIAKITTEEGVTVPYIVRTEVGVLNRDRYQIRTLFQPDQPWTAVAPQEQWNGKLLIHHGGNVGVSYGPGRPPNGDISGASDTVVIGGRALLGDSISIALARGFMTLSTAQSNLGHNANLVTAAESLVMAKEHIIEQFGPLRYTIGTGCSGGAIAQQHVANAYPGIYQGLIVQCSYPDVWTTATQFADYHLLNIYFGATVPEEPEDFLGFLLGILSSPVTAPQWAAFYGHLPLNPVVSDLAFFPSAFPNQDSCSGLADDVPLYDAETQPDGLRCGLIDYMANQFGFRPPEVWTENEQMLGRGFVGLPLDNEGVQYGLGALRDGTITGRQFLAANRDIGGLSIDVEQQPERTRADMQALENAYRTGAINTAENMENVPIIDLRGPDPGIAHDAYHSWQVRARLEATQGHADNHVIWFGPFPLAGDTVFTTEALLVMDDWLSRIEADEESGDITRRVVNNRPAEARDRCLSLSGLLNAEGPMVPLTGNLLFPLPEIPGLSELPPLPAELGQILDFGTSQVCGLDLGALGLPGLVTDLLTPVTDIVVGLQELVVQTRFGTPRTVAGDSIETLNNKCQLKPVDPDDYPSGLLFTLVNGRNFIERVEEIFPDGVCDYSKPPMGEVPTLTWLMYGDGDNLVAGGDPLPERETPRLGWASPAFEVDLNPRSGL
ncbi:MAG: hypothetical protein EA349_03115 [Halomonadaceae bacterium]|nr:MAG: hypothetical protein EA349_03115 [Halomonadaceae bacterium]